MCRFLNNINNCSILKTACHTFLTIVTNHSILSYTFSFRGSIKGFTDHSRTTDLDNFLARTSDFLWIFEGSSDIEYCFGHRFFTILPSDLGFFTFSYTDHSVFVQISKFVYIYLISTRNLWQWLSFVVRNIFYAIYFHHTDFMIIQSRTSDFSIFYHGQRISAYL